MASDGSDQRTGRDAVIFFGTIAASVLAAMVVGTVCYMEATGRSMSTGLAEAMGMIVGFYFSQLLHLTRREGSAAS